MIVALCTTLACHRSYYRRQADADATRLIEEKSLDPHWSIPGYTIEIDPASRMFDPFSQDHPPMPPDDPSAAEFMREVDGKPGFPHWHANGDTPYVANPEWRYMLPTDEEGKLVVDINMAVELALIHSPDYQRQLENLYLSALAVSLERFDFESQFFLPFNSTLTNSGRIRGGGSSVSNLSNDNGAGSQLRKAGITGSSMIVSFANSILWQYSGGDTTVGFGSLSLELIQPLLRNAGRDVILESLTDAERGLLYNVRQLERFRRGYMQQIAVGINSGGGVSVGSGSIPGVSGVSQGAGGVLGLLQNQQNIRINEANIASQRSLLEQFEEFYKFQRIDLLQLKQFRNSVYGSQSSLLSQKANYQTSLDDFKISLGLPPDIEVEVRDPILKPFVLIDEKITERQDEVNMLRDAASDIFLSINLAISGTNKEPGPLEIMKNAWEKIATDGGDPEVDLSWLEADIMFDQAIRDQLNTARGILEKVSPIYEKVVAVDFPQTESDIQRLQKSLNRRRRSLQELESRFFDKKGSSETPVIEPEVLNPEMLDTLVQDRRTEFLGGQRVNDEGLTENVKGVQTSLRNAQLGLEWHLEIWRIILNNGGILPADFLTAIFDPANTVIDSIKSPGESLQALSNKLKGLPPELKSKLPAILQLVEQNSFQKENLDALPAELKRLLPDLFQSIREPLKFPDLGGLDPLSPEAMAILQDYNQDRKKITDQLDLVLEQLEIVPDPLRSIILTGGDPATRTMLRSKAGTIKRFISEPGPEVLTILNNVIIDVSLIQALARVDSLSLPIVDIGWKDALEVARANRRDWMNARAQLVDQWRNIEVIADTLESQLDLTFSGDLQNVTDNPLKLRDRNGQIRVGLQFDAPITRLQERNNYRAALISYQQTKRTYYQFEDQISAQIREIIRLLEVVKLSYEISRIQVKNSVDEVQLASYNLVRPPAPGSTNSRVGDQTANNLIRALGNLLNNQNALIRNWVQYEVLRRQLDFNMGTMQLDERGFWIDPIEITTESIQGTMSGEFVPGVNPDLLDDGKVEPEPMNGLPEISLNSGIYQQNQNYYTASDLNRRPRPSQAEMKPQVTAPKTGQVFNASENSNSVQRLKASVSPQRKPIPRSLYSDFDSDLRRAQTTNLSVGNRELPPKQRTADKRTGATYVDRNVNPTEYVEDRQRPPRIAPFPFKMIEK